MLAGSCYVSHRQLPNATPQDLIVDLNYRYVRQFH